MKNVINIPAGIDVFLGAPARPMPEVSIMLLKKIVSQENGIIEAHIPQCYIPSILHPPSQVLFVLFLSIDGIESTLLSIVKKISMGFSPGETIEVIPLNITDALVPNIRAAGCQIYKGNTKRTAQH
jgi:hypothetical protein